MEIPAPPSSSAPSVPAPSSPTLPLSHRGPPELPLLPVRQLPVPLLTASGNRFIVSLLVFITLVLNIPNYEGGDTQRDIIVYI